MTYDKEILWAIKYCSDLAEKTMRPELHTVSEIMSKVYEDAEYYKKEYLDFLQETRDQNEKFVRDVIIKAIDNV